MACMKVNICGIEIDKFSLNQVLDITTQHVLSGTKPEYIVTPNAQHILTLQNDTYFRKIYREALLVVPDGVSLLWAAKFLRTPLNGRVNGTDLFERLCMIAVEKELKVFFLGGRPGAAELAQQTLQKRNPNLNVVGTFCPSYGFESNLAELALINTLIKSTSPHILFVGLGAPKQEYWIHENYKDLGIPISLGIGVSFELVADMVTRAPLWMQKGGFEWLFRLVVEPRRLWQRYIIGNPLFIFLVLKQRLGFHRLH